MIWATCNIRSAFPTEVPPNFATINRVISNDYQNEINRSSDSDWVMKFHERLASFLSILLTLSLGFSYLFVSFEFETKPKLELDIPRVSDSEFLSLLSFYTSFDSKKAFILFPKDAYIDSRTLSVTSGSTLAAFIFVFTTQAIDTAYIPIPDSSPDSIIVEAQGQDFMVMGNVSKTADLSQKIKGVQVRRYNVSFYFHDSDVYQLSGMLECM